MKDIDRRLFLKSVGIAGLGSVISNKSQAEPNDPNSKKSDKKAPAIPQRTLGKTGAKVPVYSFGVMFNTVENQIALRKAHSMGVNYWDTANGYSGGNSELGIGKFFKASPELRKDIFLVTKASGADSVKGIEERLQKSLERMNTNYIDLYYGVHGLSKPETELNADLAAWAESAKKRGLIRYFGFSTHTNMAACLQAAAKVDYIDAIMTSYNFRLMQDKDMLDAVEACSKKNIGLIAMKVMAQKVEGQEYPEFVNHFTKKGFTEGQAKLKAVLTDQRIATACIGGPELENIILNVAAVQDKTQLSADDMEFLKQYAAADCGGYCAGCSQICENALTADVPVRDIMRYLMYYNNHSYRDEAKMLYAQLPADVKNRLLTIDYTKAQNACPQKLPIASLISQAVQKLA